MSAHRAKNGSFSLFRWFFPKPTKPSVRPNRMALNASRRKGSGSTKALQNVVLLSLENDARLEL